MLAGSSRDSSSINSSSTDSFSTEGTEREREYSFTAAHFAKVRGELYDYAGIALADYKQNMVYNRLVRRLRHLHLHGFDDYFDYLGNHPAEFTQFINALTTNLTAFFRERHHFDYISQTVLPAIVTEKRRRLRIWSAGCSMGEEPYSLAMTLLESPADISGWDVRILATDIDSKVLTSAEAGIYARDRINALPQAMAHKWFLKGKGRRQGKVRVRQELRDLVTFRQLNLMQDWPMKGPFDLIFCRNVMIYFDKDTQENLLNRMADLLRPGGYLFVGHSETLARHESRYRLIGKTIYQRVR